MKPRLAQLAQSGATDGQVVRFIGSASRWEPSDAVTACRTTFTAAGGESVIYLGSSPIGNTEQVFVAGVYKHPGSDYTLTGTTLLLTAAATTGQHVTVAYLSASTVCGASSLEVAPRGFPYPVPLRRPVRRHHRIR